MASRPGARRLLSVLALACALPFPSMAEGQAFGALRVGIAGGVSSDTLSLGGPAFAAQAVFRFPQTFRWGVFADFRDARTGTRANLGVRAIVGSREPHVVDISAAASAGVAHDGLGADKAVWGFVLGVGGSLAAKCGYLWIDLGVDWMLQAVGGRRNTYALATAGLRVPFRR